MWRAAQQRPLLWALRCAGQISLGIGGTSPSSCSAVACFMSYILASLRSFEASPHFFLFAFMVSFTSLAMNARLKVLIAAAVCLLLLLSLYHNAVYERLPLPHTNSVTHSKSNPPQHPIAAIEATKAAVPSERSSSASLPTTLAVKTSPPDDHGMEPLAAIVAAAMKSTDISWISELADRYVPPENVLQEYNLITSTSWALYPYVVDDPSPPPELQIPKNKGHEAMVYLTFIINNWANLPPRVVFVHGHRNSWHQEGDIVHLIRSIRFNALVIDNYIPLRCDWYPSCPAEIRPVAHDAVQWGPGVHRKDAERGISDAWQVLFPNVTIPETIASQCCAQFVVTKKAKKAIQRRQKEDYERMRQWILDTELIDDVSGRVLEKLWAYIMTNEPVQ